MKAILISDHARWCVLMMNGDKKVEVRKGTALYKATQKLIDEYGYAEFYVYCSMAKHIKDYLQIENGKYVCNVPKDYESELNGKVLFKFRCYKVEEITPLEEYESPFGLAYKLTEDKILCCYKAHLTYDEYNHYLKGKIGTAIHISDLEIFDKPKELSEFKSYKKNIVNTRINGMVFETELDNSLIKAPQSYMFIETEGL